MYAISVYTNGLRNAYYQAGERPDHARIAVSSQAHQKENQSLQYDKLLRNEEVGTGQSLLNREDRKVHGNLPAERRPSRERLEASDPSEYGPRRDT